MSSVLFQRSLKLFRRTALRGSYYSNQWKQRQLRASQKIMTMVFSGVAVTSVYSNAANNKHSSNTTKSSLYGMQYNVVSNHNPNLQKKDHLNLNHVISDVQKKVDSNKLLEVFKKMNASNEKDITQEFLNKMFEEVGIFDNQISKHLFNIIDINKDGVLQASEVAAVITLFNNAHDTDSRFKFLFKCLDLDNGGTIDKNEFRATIIALLDAQYHLKGLTDPFDDNEIFSNITPEEYHTVAKFKANRIVRDVFLIADRKKRGELSKKEFLFWCRRRSKEVRLLESVFLDAVNSTFL